MESNEPLITPPPFKVVHDWTAVFHRPPSAPAKPTPVPEKPGEKMPV